MLQEMESDGAEVSFPAASIPPAVSIIIPVYNGESYLATCISSILSQSFTNLELIIVDDCSTDGSIAIIERETHRDQRVLLFRQQVNRGAPAARNLGLRVAKGDYLMFVDADDTLVDDALSVMMRIAYSANSDAVKGTMLEQMGESSRRTQHRLNQKSAQENTRLADCPEIQHLYQYQSYLFRSSLIRKLTIEFDTDLKNFQDPVFLAKLLPRCQRVDICLSPVYVRRVRPDSIITSDWTLANYLSMVHGVSRAYSDLIKDGQLGAAEMMATTFARWWHKIELLPELLTKVECFKVFQEIEVFSRISTHDLCKFSWLGVGAYHSLELIAEQRFEECYKKMATRLRLKKQIILPLLKLYDIGSYWFAGGRKEISDA